MTAAPRINYPSTRPFDYAAASFVATKSCVKRHQGWRGVADRDGCLTSHLLHTTLHTNRIISTQSCSGGGKLKRWMITLGLGVVVLVVTVVAAGYLATMSVVGHFAPSFKATPADYGLRAEAISFRSLDGIELKGWWIPAQGSPAVGHGTVLGTVVLAHGNGGNRSSMLARAAFLARNGYNAFPIDLRAHGESAGNYMTPGYLEALDILGAVEAAKRQGQKGKFVVLGHSYGARAALWAAAQSKEISAVIADSGFVSIYGSLHREAARVGTDPNASFWEKVGLRMANSLSGSSWARAFMETAYHWRTGARLPSQFDDVTPAILEIGNRPILFIVGENDHIAPREDSQHMYDVAQSPMKGILLVPDADHNSTFTAQPDVYRTRVLDFLDDTLTVRAHGSSVR